MDSQGVGRRFNRLAYLINDSVHTSGLFTPITSRRCRYPLRGGQFGQGTDAGRATGTEAHVQLRGIEGNPPDCDRQ